MQTAILTAIINLLHTFCNTTLKIKKTLQYIITSLTYFHQNVQNSILSALARSHQCDQSDPFIFVVYLMILVINIVQENCYFQRF